VKNAAVQRLAVRRNQVRHREVRDEFRDVTVRIPITGPDIPSARDLGEWCDDRELRVPAATAAGLVMYQVIEAAPVSVKATVAALGEARRLDCVEQ
jgi:hypothetical protein